MSIFQRQNFTRFSIKFESYFYFIRLRLRSRLNFMIPRSLGTSNWETPHSAVLEAEGRIPSQVTRVNKVVK